MPERDMTPDEMERFEEQEIQHRDEEITGRDLPPSSEAADIAGEHEAPASLPIPNAD